MELPKVGALLAVTTVGLIALTGCSTSAEPDRGPGPSWTERELPSPAGPPGRTVVRDAVRCGAGWWVVGAVFLDHPTETRDTRPAAWFSTDRTSWTPVDVQARTYWGRRAIINSVACSRSRLAAVGARSGGAHGNPRVTTCRVDDRGRLVDVPAVFTQYGGVSATNVGPIAGGPSGWLIAGNRLFGPGVWFTDDPRVHPRGGGHGLTGDPNLGSLAQGAGWAGDSGRPTTAATGGRFRTPHAGDGRRPHAGRRRATCSCSWPMPATAAGSGPANRATDAASGLSDVSESGVACDPS